MPEIVGQVLAENAPMLAFARRLGFALRRLPEEPEVRRALWTSAAESYDRLGWRAHVVNP